VPETELPGAVLKTEIARLEEMGLEFQFGVEVGKQATVDSLAHRCDAVLLAVGEMSPEEAVRLGVPLAGNGPKTDPNTCKTHMAKVFAAGAVLKPLKQLVRALAEGRAAAECMHRFLSGQAVRRPEKPFSSVMGRLAPGELKQFLATVSADAKVSPCDRCAGLNRQEAPREAARCLHCDCRSSGNCVLQHYAQSYGADASRFRSERRTFEQEHQPGGVIFEPGKCILCGICVKLTEMAGEPLGLTFVERGFDVRVSAPFDHTIQEGLQKVAKECVEQCPTGALAFDEKVAVTGKG
jgi:ferredoxin